MDTAKFSDRGYRRLFSHPRMVEDLLRAFVSPDLAREFDFSALKKRSVSYVTKEFRDRESDLIWEVRLRGRLAFVYILIEFESTVNRFMALRVLTYLLLFYQDLVEESERRLKVLPAVFPVVVYNGEEKWDAPLCLEKLIDIPFPSLDRYIPRFKYYKIAENEFSREGLEAMEGLAAQMFRLDTGTVGELPEIVRGVIRILEREAPEELRRDFRRWLCRLLRKRGLDVDLMGVGESEVYPMLLARLEKYREDLLVQGRREGKAEGKKEGKKEGRKEGEKKGRREALKLLLEARFGEGGRGLWGQIDVITDTRRIERLIRRAAVETDLGSMVKALNSRGRPR
ncbi:MAG: Rpn family recombination-promoting nuclease/putative transposase [Candidatus Riflebacteria bacterium]|nr:Rpn family recombination-promoting nuclease/putative transposase [Candidatus Riflebacteria bacterium]